MLQDLAYTIVYVNDLERCTAFYRDVLGLPVQYSVDGWTQFASHGAAVVLHRRVDGGAPAAGAVHLAFRVTDLQAAYDQLVRRQVKFVAPPATTAFGKHATFCDPEDNRIDLVEWSGAREPEPVTARTIVNDVLRASPEAMGVLEEHGIRICGGCIVLLNGTVQDTAEYSGLSASETAQMTEELNAHVHHNREA